jgi:hypothetical protein
LLAANKIGILLKGSDYEDAMDAAVHLCQGVDLVFVAYDSACTQQQATTPNVGNAWHFVKETN